MKHFQIGHHKAAVSSIAVIAVSLSLAATAAGQGTTAIMMQPADDQSFSKLYSDAIDNIGQARQTVEQLFTDFRNNGGATEAKDFDHVLGELISAGYMRADSTAINIVTQKGLDAAFSRLDALADAAVDKLTWARDNILPNGTDAYLGYTAPAQAAVDDMMKFARDLHLVISATWRDLNQQESIVVTDIEQPADTSELVAA